LKGAKISLKMPEKLDKSMFASCGMNCIICGWKKICGSCFGDDDAKLEHCKTCEIKVCVTKKGLTYCFECDEFPCNLNEKLDDYYLQYHWSWIMNSQDAKEDGIEFTLERDRKYWTCDRCGGVVSIHEGKCSDCNADISDMRLGPYAHFGMIDCFDENKNFIYFDGTFEERLKEHHCVALPDDIIDNWWDSLTSMKSYFHSYDRPETALARWGVTLIPPESLDLFSEIIKNCTSEKYLTLCEKEIAEVLSLLEKAKRENKFIIHYGV